MPPARNRTRFRTRRALATAGMLAISFLHLMLAAMLVLFGLIVGWDAEPGRPVAGGAMLLAGIAVFVLGPRVIRRLTGREPIAPPPYT